MRPYSERTVVAFRVEEERKRPPPMPGHRQKPSLSQKETSHENTAMLASWSQTPNL